MTHKVLIVDNFITRKGLKEVIHLAMKEAEVIEAATMDAAVTAVKENPDLTLALIDLMQKSNDGITLIGVVQQYAPNAKTIIISGKDDESTLSTVTVAGANGFISKSSEIDKMIDDIQLYLNGALDLQAATPEKKKITDKTEGLLSNDLSNRLRNYLSDYSLTSKEQRVTKLILDGLNDKEISDLTYLSVGTIKNHLKAICDKLGVINREELINKIITH